MPLLSRVSCADAYRLLQAKVGGLTELACCKTLESRLGSTLPKDQREQHRPSQDVERRSLDDDWGPTGADVARPGRPQPLQLKHSQAAQSTFLNASRRR